MSSPIRTILHSLRSDKSRLNVLTFLSPASDIIFSLPHQFFLFNNEQDAQGKSWSNVHFLNQSDLQIWSDVDCILCYDSPSQVGISRDFQNFWCLPLICYFLLPFQSFQQDPRWGIIRQTKIDIKIFKSEAERESWEDFGYILDWNDDKFKISIDNILREASDLVYIR